METKQVPNTCKKKIKPECKYTDFNLERKKSKNWNWKIKKLNSWKNTNWTEGLFEGSKTNERRVTSGAISRSRKK